MRYRNPLEGLSWAVTWAIVCAGLILLTSCSKPTQAPERPLEGITATREEFRIVDSVVPQRILYTLSFSGERYAREVGIKDGQGLARTYGTYRLQPCVAWCDYTVTFERTGGEYWDSGEWYPTSGSLWAEELWVGADHIRINRDVYLIQGE